MLFSNHVYKSINNYHAVSIFSEQIIAACTASKLSLRQKTLPKEKTLDDSDRYEYFLYIASTGCRYFGKHC